MTHYCDEDVPRGVRELTGLVEPLMTIFGGGAVGFAVFATFMPIMKLFGAIGGAK